MSELKPVEHITKVFEGKKLTIFDDGEPKFLLRDLCTILNLGQVSGVKRRLDEDVIWNHPLKTKGGTQIAIYVNEDGLYDVILDSRKSEAKKFRKWITSEVLPSIRKTGGYEVEQPQSIEDLIIMQAESVKEVKERLETVETKQDHITEIVSLNNNNWRKEVNKIINTIAKNNGGSYKQTRQESYSRLENRARCDLERRLANKKERMRKEGQSRKALDTTNKLSVIADDTRLTEIYLAVVKEMAIVYEGGKINE